MLAWKGGKRKLLDKQHPPKNNLNSFKRPARGTGEQPNTTATFSAQIGGKASGVAGWRTGATGAAQEGSTDLLVCNLPALDDNSSRPADAVETKEQQQRTPLAATTTTATAPSPAADTTTVTTTINSSSISNPPVPQPQQRVAPQSLDLLFLGALRP